MKKFSESITALMCFGVIILLITFSAKARIGAVEGINLCEGIIIPSLLPVLILSNTVLMLKSKRAKTKAVLLGLIAGYPSGAILTKELYKNKIISSNEAKRIMCFNFCGGFAFIISAVGSIVYKNKGAGIILYISCVLSSVIIALITKPFYNKSSTKPLVQGRDFNSALCRSVELSVKSIAVMSAYIILFSALLKLFYIPDYIIPLLEITNGICKAKVLPSLPFCAFFLSFGGLCIHFQILPFLKEMKINYFFFLLFRLLSASLSYLICKIIIHFSGDAIIASSSLSPTLPFELSKLGGGLSMVMIIGCAALVFDLENRKIKN
ncbi:MAG: hypothetical protein E7570_02905 [Ruminococcaceae bacterium]|nr:hypothetical protein [Oscillospiraceae bacterium]